LTVAASHARRRRAFWLLWVAMPLAALGSQIASKLVADSLQGARVGWPLVGELARMPAAWAVVVCELSSLCAWMVILTEISLGAAFAITALSYVLVVAAGAVVFHESIGALQLAGSAAILAGVWLIGRAE